MKRVSVDDLFVMVVARFGPEFGRQAFERANESKNRFELRGPFEMRVRVDLVGSINRRGVREPWVGVKVPGTVCRAVGTDAVLDLIEDMQCAGGLHVARLDLALDDFDKTVSPRQFACACVDGSLDDENALLGEGVVTRVRRDSWEWRRAKGGCFILGLGRSERLLRVYDKERESNGRIASVRIELQSRNEFATTLARRLVAARKRGDALGEVFASHLVAFVDLRVPDGGRSGSSAWRRLPWFEGLVGGVAAATTGVRGEGEFAAWFRALQRQFAGVLTVLLCAAGVTDEDLAGSLGDPPRTGDPEGLLRKLRQVVRWVLGGRLRPLSSEHEVRLEQARDARAVLRELSVSA